MEHTRDFLEGLEAVKDPLTFWAFLATVALAAMYAFLQSSKFHELWSRILGDSLSSEQVFRLARYFLVGTFVLLVLIVVAVSTAPLILQWIYVDAKKIEASILSGEETAAIRRDFVRAMAVFKEERDYLRSRKLLVGIRRQVSTEDSRNTVDGYITATYDGQGQHRDGLHYICNLYKTKPPDSIEYRFAIHAHIRGIALKEGFDIAEEVAVEFATKCGRKDFSPVWVGIPRAKMEFLKDGRTLYEDYFHLSETEREYLRGIVRHYPLDGFVDHAHYFLHEFDKVIGTDSIIESVSILAAIQKEEGVNFPKSIGLMKMYLEKYPNSKRYEDIRDSLTSSLLLSGRLSEGLEFAVGEKLDVNQHLHHIFHGFSASVQRIGLDETLAIAKKYKFHAILLAHEHDDSDGHPISDEHSDSDWHIVSDSHYYLEEHFDNIWSFLSFIKLHSMLESFKNAGLLHIVDQKVDSLWHKYYDSVGFQLIESDNLQSALEEYDSQRQALGDFGLSVPELLVKRIRDLESIMVAETQDDPQVDVDVAIYLREIGAESLALARFNSIADSSRDSIAVQRALYLSAAMLRRNGQYADAKKTFERLWEQYPDGDLADDAVAEVGWYHLMVEGDVEGARKFFDMVLAEYPEENAADNALNWIARSYLRRGMYREALANYIKLASIYTGSRLGDGAKRTVERLKEVIQSERSENRLVGVRVYENRVMNVDPEKTSLSWGDVIVELNDYSVTDEGSLSAALATVEESFTDVEVIRGSGGQRLRFRLAVEEVMVYDDNWFGPASSPTRDIPRILDIPIVFPQK